MDGTTDHSIPVGGKDPPHHVLARRYARRPLVRALARFGLSAAGVALFTRCVPLPFQANQPARVPHVGYLAIPSAEPGFDRLRQGLQDLGYRDGETIVLDHRSADGQVDRLPALASELVRLPVDVVVAPGNTAIRAARDATSAIPIVMQSSGVDPVAVGLVSNWARPGGNVTGLTVIYSELSGKRLELLKEAVPELARVAVLWNSGQPDKLLEVQETRSAAQKLGIEVQEVAVRDAAELAGAIESARRGRADGLIVLRDGLTFIHTQAIVDLALASRLPSMYSSIGFVDAGGLLFYGPDPVDLERRAATYVYKILKGTPPGDLPVERPTKLDLRINLRTARALGIQLPQSLLVQAAEAIE